MSKYYIYQSITRPLAISCIKQYRFTDNQQGLYAIISTSNCIQLHRVLRDGLALHSRHPFYASITRIQTIPSHHHESDFLWILDDKGRYACWRPEQGFIVVSNRVLADGFDQQETEGVRQLQRDMFSGVAYSFDQQDTVGVVFFTIGRRIVTVEFSVTSQGVTMYQPVVQKFEEDCLAIRFVDWLKVNSGDYILGLVVECEDGTALKIYQMNREGGFGKSIWTIQRKNMLQFYSQGGSDLIVLTYDDVTLYRYKQSAPVCSYRTRGCYSQGFCLGQGIYGHIGKELIVFSQQKIVPFNKCKFQDACLFQEGGFRQCCFLGRMKGVGAILCLVTHRSQLYFLTLSEPSSKITRLTWGAPSITDIRPFSNRLNLFALVGSYSSSQHRVLLAQSVARGRVFRQQSVHIKIDRLLCTVEGSYLIVCAGDCNFIMRLSREQDYSFYFQLPRGQLIDAKGDILLMEDGIYQLDYQYQSCTKRVQQRIDIGLIIGERVYYLCTGVLWVWQGKISQKLMQRCQGDYCWGIVGSEMLVCANLHNINHLQTILQKQIKSIPIKGHTIINALSSIHHPRQKRSIRQGEDCQILVGYCDGSIHIQSQTGHIIDVFRLWQCGSMLFEAVGGGGVMVSCGRRQYLLRAGKTGVALQDVQLSREGEVLTMTYLQRLDQLLLVQGEGGSQVIRQVVIGDGKDKITRITPVGELFKQLPSIITIDDRVIVAERCKITIYYLYPCKNPKTHSHKLIQVRALQHIKMGMVLAGSDSENVETIQLWTQQLQLLFSIHTAAKYPLRSLCPVQGTNDFFLWSGNNAALYRFEQTGQLKLLFGSNLPLQGYQADLNSSGLRFIVSDPTRFLALYSCEGSIVQQARYIPAFQVIELAFLGEELVLSDTRGNLMLLACEREQPLLNRFTFSRLGVLNLGQGVAAFCKSVEALFFVTKGGGVCRVGGLEREEFERLRKLEGENLLKEEQDTGFSYLQWRGRTVLDRVVDGALLS